jgi:predicted phage terminase large subunit-like protein
MVDPESVRATLLRFDFSTFVSYAFKRVHGEKLGTQPYVQHVCHVISGLITRRTKRLLINMPPQHLKSFVGTICLSAFLLGSKPRQRILLVAYNDEFAASLCDKIRDMMQTGWYRSIFSTRIKEGHSRRNDFQTTEGGGIFAVGATGAVTGRTADFIIYDDPHEISDWNDDRKLSLVRNNFNILLSRLHDKANGPVLVIAHRISWDDLSADLLRERGWDRLRLPLVAVKRQRYELGHDEWVREKGDILQPTVYPKREIERLKRTQIEPPFELFYQQGIGSRASQAPQPKHFQTFTRHETPIAPVVLSIDPGQGGGLNASRSVIQAWKFHGRRYFLIDQFCDHCDLEEQRKHFWLFARRHRPSVALIEKTASGPSLYAAVRRKAHFHIKLVVPTTSKGIRLASHLSKIRSKRIFLPEDALWRDDFVEEVVHFPTQFDDQVDAMTQYLDFMDTKPSIPKQPPNEVRVGLVLGSHYFPRRFY